MAIEAIKKKYPIVDENGQPSTYPTFASQVFFEDGTVLEGKIDPLTIYPVGSIYMSVSNTDPALLFGGTWEVISGRFLYSADDGHWAGAMGGEEKVTLTVNEMPAHNHQFREATSAGESTGYRFVAENGKYSHAGVYMSNTGGGKAHNNMPPYLAVYMWKRIPDEEVA